MVKSEKENELPEKAGLTSKAILCYQSKLWENVYNFHTAVYGILKKGLSGPPEECYVGSVNVLPNEAHIVVTLDVELAPLIHFHSGS